MIARTLCLMAALTAPAGCAEPPPEPLLLVRGSAEVSGTGAVWCYATLADPDCLMEPDRLAQNRLIGAYIPLPPVADDAP